MLCKDFNKLGGTEFRVKNQILGYTQVAQFLIMQLGNEIKKEINIDDLDKEFKKFVLNEQIYSYNNDKKIKNRLSMVIKLFKQIDLIRQNQKNLIIEKKKIEKILFDPTRNFFQLFVRYFPFFKEAMVFAYENNNINPFIFSTTMLIYEENVDNFSEVYFSLLTNYEEVLKKLVFQNFKTENPNDINPQDFIKSLRKKSNDNKFIEEALINIKNNKPINEELIYNLLKTRFIDKFFIPLKINGFVKEKGRKNKPIKNKKQILQNYFKEISYERFVMDIHIARIWANVGDEYNDLMQRWLENFGLVKKNKIINNQIEIIESNDINYRDMILEIDQYPYNLNEVKNNLMKIQENDFTFKFSDKNLKDISNSTLAEYFVNLFVAQRAKIQPNEFDNFSRTKLQPGTLLPLSHAPGRGPDMYVLKENKLIIIETTIHKTIKQIINNEVFNVIDHVDLNKISYLKQEIKEKIRSTKIILVTFIRDKEELKEIKIRLDQNYLTSFYNCGVERISVVTNFKEIANK